MGDLLKIYPNFLIKPPMGDELGGLVGKLGGWECEGMWGCTCKYECL